MPAPTPTLPDFELAFARYDNGERPWRQTLNRVDWFIAYSDRLYPLKYTYSLATSVAPATYTTDQMKHAMRSLHLPYISLKSQREELDQFEAEVQRSLADRKGRLERLQTAIPNSRISYTVVASFNRNPDVVAEVLDRANGHCESCRLPAPFARVTDGTPYLEVHHIVFLANGGEDTVSNAEALCPNCHRKKHFG